MKNSPIIGAGTYDGRVAHPPAVLVGESAGRSGGGQMPGAVERDGPHGAAARRTRRVQPLALGAPRLLELPLAPLGAEISARHERHALLERELFRALGHEQYVRALLH